jgi:hypothetical protein
MLKFQSWMDIQEIYLNTNIKKTSLGKQFKSEWEDESVSGTAKKLSSKFGPYQVLMKQKGKVRYYAVVEQKTNQYVMFIELHSWSNVSWYVNAVTVTDNYLGQGLAPKFYRWLITDQNLSLVSGKEQSPGGRAIWQSLSAMRGVKVFGWDTKTRKAFSVDPKTLEANVDYYNDRIESEIKDAKKQLRVTKDAKKQAELEKMIKKLESSLTKSDHIVLLAQQA